MLDTPLILIKRKTAHKTACCNEKDKNYNVKVYKTIREIGGWNEIEMLEVEKFPCNDVNEAKTRERYWLELLSANLNTSIPCRTRKEYREANKESLNEKSKEFYSNNKDAILAKQKIYYENHKVEKNEKVICLCGGTFTSLKNVHLKTKKHQKYVEDLNKTQ